MKISKPKSVSKYLEPLPLNQKKVLQDLRETILSCLKKDESEELISYGIPTFKYKRKPLIGFGAFKNHLSLFIMMNSDDPELKELLSGYSWNVSTVQFLEEKPLPKTLVRKIVRYKKRLIDDAIERAKKLK